MCVCYEAALTDTRIIDPAVLRDLYAGREFPPRPDWSIERQLAWAGAQLRGESVPEDLADWRELVSTNTATAPKMAVYEAAAGAFNALLAETQRHGERLDEKPTTGSALQRAMAREVCREGGVSG
jgi:hypothetical protein